MPPSYACHLSGRGDFDYVYRYNGEKKRLEKEIPEWRRRGKVIFYRAGIDWDHLDRIFEMFREASVNDAAVHTVMKRPSAPAVIDLCVTALKRFGTRSFSQTAAPTLKLLDAGGAEWYRDTSDGDTIYTGRDWYADLAVTMRKLTAAEKRSRS